MEELDAEEFTKTTHQQREQVKAEVKAKASLKQEVKQELTPVTDAPGTVGVSIATVDASTGSVTAITTAKTQKEREGQTAVLPKKIVCL